MPCKGITGRHTRLRVWGSAKKAASARGALPPAGVNYLD